MQHVSAKQSQILTRLESLCEVRARKSVDVQGATSNEAFNAAFENEVELMARAIEQHMNALTLKRKP